MAKKMQVFTNQCKGNGCGYLDLDYYESFGKSRLVEMRKDDAAGTIRRMPGSQSYIPDGQTLCDHCLLIKYGLGDKGMHDTCDQLGMGPRLYEEPDVLTVIRKLTGE